MPDIKVLSTRPLAEEIITRAASKGIQIVSNSFIKTENKVNIEVRQSIEYTLTLATSVVFTSMNAVEAVAKFVLSKPDWKIYCIGNTTKQLVEKYFGKHSIAGFADNATLLAEEILVAQPSEVAFFCGKQRRPELPEILRHNGIKVDEIMVYETIALLQKVDEKYDGILFFSPSAVQSFFGMNKISSKTVLFAIGSTTAKEIREYSFNKIIISDKPGKEYLTEKMIEYFRV